MIAKLRHHYIALMLALGIGIISVAPQLFFVLSAPNFNGVHMFGTDAEHHFLARIQEVYDGHYALGGVFSTDKDRPYMMPGLGENIVAVLGKILHLSAPDMNVLSKFLFPILIFLLIYLFAHQLFSSRTIAVLAALLAMFGQDLMSGPKYVFEMLSFRTSAFDFLSHSRPIHPQINALFLFGGLYALFKALKTGEGANKKWVIFFGVILGLSVYVYIYTWSFLMVLAGLYLLYFLYQRNKHKIRLFFYTLAVHVVISIPYWINFIQARFDPAYEDTAMRFGAIGNHTPIFGTWVMILFVVALLFWPKKYKESETLFILIAASLLIVLNQQVITGIVLQEAHYHWNVTKPAGVAIVSAMLIVCLLEKFVKYRKIANMLIVVAVGLLFSHASLIQAASYRYEYPFWVERQRYGDVIRYLDSAYDSPQVIWSTNDELSAYLSGYTKHDAIIPHSAVYYLEGRDHFIVMLFLQYRLKGISPEEIHAFMQKERSNVSQFIYAIYYREKLGSRALVPDEILFELSERYKDFYNLNYEDIFSNLKIDVIAWDKKKEVEIDYTKIPILHEAATVSEDFIIYEVDGAI